MPVSKPKNKLQKLMVEALRELKEQNDKETGTLSSKMIADLQETERVNNQYECRILHLLNGRTKEQLLPDEVKTFDLLVRGANYDPRRKDVGYLKKEGVEIFAPKARRLNALTDEQFLTDPYVLEWVDEESDVSKVCNLPLPDDPEQRPYQVVMEIYKKSINQG